MKLLIESADVDQIRRGLDYYPIDGAVLRSTVGLDVQKKIRGVIGEDCELHVPIERLRAEDIVEEARRLVGELGPSTYVGISVGAEGFRAMKRLASSEVSFTAVGVRTPMQALMAGKCGASYVVPQINRLDGRSAVETVKNMFDALRNNHLETEVIATRFKVVRQAIELCEYGISAVSVTPEMLSSMIDGDIR